MSASSVDLDLSRGGSSVPGRLGPSGFGLWPGLGLGLGLWAWAGGGFRTMQSTDCMRAEENGSSNNTVVTNEGARKIVSCQVVVRGRARGR